MHTSITILFHPWWEAIFADLSSDRHWKFLSFQMCSQLVWRLVHWCAVSSWQGVYQQDWLGKIQRKYKIFRRTKIWQKKHLMKPSLKAIVAILESSIVKTDDVTSGRRDMDPHGRLRAVQGRMGQWKILRHSRALTVQKWSQKFDACAELLLLLLFVIKKKALYLKTKVLNEDTILHLLLETRPPFFVVIRASRREYLYRSVVV